MLRPVIFIGCGGSGTKAVRYVRDAVHRRLDDRGWKGGMPDAWQFIGLDTLTVQEDPREIPELPAPDFLSLSGEFERYQGLYASLTHKYSADGPIPNARPLCGWLPDPADVRVPLKDGAGQMRGIGRAAGLLALERAVLDRLQRAFGLTGSGGPQLRDVGSHLGFESELGGEAPETLVVVVSSMAGGTGAGVVLDVVDLVRACDPSGGYPALVLFTNDIFDLPDAGSMAANSLGLMSELLAAYWSRPGEIESPLDTRAVYQPGVGPHSIFMLGRYSYTDRDLGSTKEVYRAAGEALSTWVVDDVVQTEIINFTHVNWQTYAKNNQKAYPFAKAYLSGAVSSFGAAKITVGRDRFALWAEHLLGHQVLESLSMGHVRLSQLGGLADDGTEEERIEALGRHYADRIHRGATGVGNATVGFPSAAESFASHEMVLRVRDEVIEALQFPANAQGPGEQWENRLKAVGGRLADEWASKADVPPDVYWCREMVEAICRATSAVAALSSLSVAAAALLHVVKKTNPAEVNKIRKEAKKAESAYRTEVKRGLAALRVDGELRGDSDEVRAAAESIAQGVAQRWRAKRLEHAADTMEAAGEQVFGSVLRSIKAAQLRVGRALQEDRVKAWPSGIDDLPARYLPSTVEFPLERHDQWPGLLGVLGAEARIDGVPFGNRPTDALRYRLIAGDSEMVPLIRPGEHHHWQPGQQAHVVCEVGEDDIEMRVHEWTRRPDARFHRTVSEGLRTYLADEDEKGRKRDDHPDRMATFREQLGKAKQAADPLISINAELYDNTNDVNPPVIRTLCSKFPFGDGHPAKEPAQSILGTDSFSPSMQDSSWVLVSSYIKDPFHPVAVTSFSEPVARALQNIADPERRPSKFWLWRRGRTLEAFVPLPRAALEAMVAGYAVARLCGYITSDPTSAIRITASSDGEREFPWPLLTSLQDWDDLLAALLESFCLTFGTVGRRKDLRVYDAYQRLYDLGLHTRQGRITPDLSQLLETGEPTYSTAESETPKAVGASADERRRAAIDYLKVELDRFKSHGEMNHHMVRPEWGGVEPGAMTTELAPIFRRCYQDLRDLIAGKQQTGSVT